MKYTQHKQLSNEYIVAKIADFLAEDMPDGDKTTEGTIPEGLTISAEIQSGEELVFAGEKNIHHCFGAMRPQEMIANRVVGHGQHDPFVRDLRI